MENHQKMGKIEEKKFIPCSYNLHVRITKTPKFKETVHFALSNMVLQSYLIKNHEILRNVCLFLLMGSGSILGIQSFFQDFQLYT